MSSTTTRGSGPLRGIRVLDATTMLAGPYLGALLADFGADVVKVEDVGAGDPMRATPPIVEDRHVPSLSTNRNKRSVALDLRTDEARVVFRRMCREVDIVLVNFRPRTLRRWNLDYDDLARGNPRLVMFHLTAFGRDGVEADRPGFARIAEAFAGLTNMSGEADGPPMFSGFPIADGAAGAHGAFAVLLALFERERTGRGQLVDMALYEPILRMLDGVIASYDLTGEEPRRVGNDNRDIAPNGLYATSDGWIVLPISSPNMWRRLCEALDAPDLATDRRFVTNVQRVQHREELDARLLPIFRRWKTTELLDQLRRHDVAAGPVNTMADLFQNDHVWDTRSLIRVYDAGLHRGVAMPGVVPRLSATPGEIRSLGPEPGEHSAAVLRELADVDGVELARLVASGVVGLAAANGKP